MSQNIPVSRLRLQSRICQISNQMLLVKYHTYKRDGVKIIRKAHVHELATISLICLTLVSAEADLSAFKLCSPKNGDHFEVAEPLLFWQSCIGASRYDVFIDGTKVISVPAAPIPVMSCALSSPLPTGVHHWFIKAVSASGGDIASDKFAFDVEPSARWPSWAIGPFVRYGENPLLEPIGSNWQSRNVFNPGVLFDQGRFRMLYRAQGRGDISRLGYAESLDGVTFIRNPDPQIDATEPFEQEYGCEDPRIFNYEGRYYIFYTGNSEQTIALCEATSTDGFHWAKLGPVEDNVKNGAVICGPTGTPVRIKGRFAMFVGDSSCGVCYSDDLTHWGPITWIDMNFPSDWVTPYEPCFAVADYSTGHPDDVVLFIAGTLNGKGRWFYAISEVRFSKADLTRKTAQLNDCILKPREPYESGQNKNCLWMNCIIQHDGEWWMYYGAGDRNVALATAPFR